MDNKQTKLTSTTEKVEAAAGIRRKSSKSWILIPLLLLGPIILFSIYFKVLNSGLTSPEALDFAQVGRNLGSGKGFSTYIIRPLAMRGDYNVLRQPDTMHGPLYPFMLALAFGIFGAKDAVVSLTAGLFYVLTIPMVYLLGKLLFNPLIGILGAIAFAVNSLYLSMALSGMHITLFVFLSTSLFLVLHSLYRAQQEMTEATGAKLNKGTLFLSAALTGALYLTDPVFFWITLAMTGSLFWMFRKQWSEVGIWYALPLLILIMPWMVRNGMLSGNPIFGLRGAEVWMNTSAYPGNYAYRLFPSEMTPEGGLFGAILRKGLLNAGQILQTFLLMPGNWLLAFLLPALFFRLQDKAQSRMRGVVLLCFLALCLEIVLFTTQTPLFLCIVPALLLFALAYVQHLVEESKLDRFSTSAIAAVLGIMLIYPLFSDIALIGKEAKSPMVSAALTLKSISKEGDVCISDQPWLPAWYADRPSVWIPVSDKKTEEFRIHVTGVRWLFLTDQSRNFSPLWSYIYNTFTQWNFEYVEKQSQGKPKPAGIVIGGKGQPLIEALQGFKSVEPRQGLPLNIVIANAPADTTRVLSSRDNQPLSTR